MFYSILVESWEDALLLNQRLSNLHIDWAFRGQLNELWGLSTKFERDAVRYGCDPYFFMNRESFILSDFQRRAHHYVQNLPSSDGIIEWLSLLQHHGGATRLLDFTYSYYVALFFALETADTNSAIWVINLSKFITQLSKLMEYDIRKEKQSFKGIIEQNIHWAETLIHRRETKDVLFLIEPFYQHERISIQQGLFLFPANIITSFEANMCSFFEFRFNNLNDENATRVKLRGIDDSDLSKAAVLKIILPLDLHSQALFELTKMNVTSATLFPGLDGFARSLSFRFREADFLINTGKKP